MAAHAPYLTLIYLIQAAKRPERTRAHTGRNNNNDEQTNNQNGDWLVFDNAHATSLYQNTHANESNTHTPDI